MKKHTINQTMDALVAAGEKKTAQALEDGYFECKQPQDTRSNRCTGIGYKHGKERKTCSVCIEFQAKTRGAANA